MDALQGFPDFETKLVTEKGTAICQKQDIFKGLMWFAYTDNFANWHILKIDQVKEIIEENKLKNKVSSLEDYALEPAQAPEKDFNNAMGQESLTRFDQPKRKKKPAKKRKPGENTIVANNNKPEGNNKPQNNNNNKQQNNRQSNNNKQPNQKNSGDNIIKPNQNRPAIERKPGDNIIKPVNKNDPEK